MVVVVVVAAVVTAAGRLPGMMHLYFEVMECWIGSVGSGNTTNHHISIMVSDAQKVTY